MVSEKRGTTTQTRVDYSGGGGSYTASATRANDFDDISYVSVKGNGALVFILPRY